MTHYADTTGRYIGAFEGAEPPAGAVLVPVPPERADMLWNGTAWVAPPVTVEQALTNLKAARVEAMCSGVTVDGMQVQTDPQSIAMLTGAALAATLDPAMTVEWKLADNSFTTLTSAQMIAVAMAARAHVQACYSREAVLAAQIRAAADPGSVEISF